MPLPPARSYSIIGGNGAGKSRFMELLISGMQERHSILSPIGDTPPYQIGSEPNIQEALLTRHYSANQAENIISIWNSIFPDSHIHFLPEGILFSNSLSRETFGFDRLSRGEKTAFWFLSAVAAAEPDSIIFVDSPSIFLHPSVSSRLWTEIENWRSDSTFIYDTADPVFAASRNGNIPIWIKSYVPHPEGWHYSIITPGSDSDEFLLEILGSRRPVLFIEGDSTNSIDVRLYSSIFRQYQVQPVGSCNKVIEATRTFNSLSSMHRLESHGLVDRDRRSASEVSYLRLKNIMVPEVAEVENIFLSEDVVRIMARHRKRNPETVFRKLKTEVIEQFRKSLDSQVLQHTRHFMKRDVERKIDARFTCITALELHIKSLINKLRPRDRYNTLMREFRLLLSTSDYAGILRVFNEKRVFRQSSLHPMLGFSGPDKYIDEVLKILHTSTPEAEQLREAILKLFTPSPEKNNCKESQMSKNAKPSSDKVVKHNRGRKA